ncbi:hypothetical protein [Methylobacterium haplocladii]|uniref:Uncharacterized protein n=1 Tax=Methylobacterium haplocladii TaxID=1176176 RepID=A0A512IRA5_9HYPH|nr:hypothetical protein [Methylobacterium haplocladii]GEP00213.1 hypothetical protein MHA02_26000 [Methylobacterium haplocladii]GJD84278.1 hypothetical protein HPGCJGGD_2154 [Methylobacterium haplocladii]GLS57941.1 hypothetical protein GCM10007887_05970 [Methylobacterium haplocladii]
MNESVERVSACLADLVRAALISDDRRSLEFRDAARAGLAALAADPPDPATVRIDGAWTFGIRAAEAPDMVAEARRVNLTLPQASPFTLAELVDPAFDVDAAVERIANAASTG